MPIKLGQLLVKQGVITPEQLETALTHQKQHGGQLSSVLDKLGIIKESKITGLLKADSDTVEEKSDPPMRGELLEAKEIDLQKEEPPIAELCDSMLGDAVRRGASEIHIEPCERELRVRFRIDGVLYVVMNPPLRLREAILRRIKLMARLEGAEKNVPQRGGIRIRVSIDRRTREIFFSVSILSTIWGEKIFLRVIDKEPLSLNLNELGFEPESLQRFDKALRAPGLVLIAGPMGSGKTTTAYRALRSYNVREVNIVTVEETIGYHLPGVNHVEVGSGRYRETVGAALVENPQILMVDQISDPETAVVAAEAALQGPLVLSTMNANDSVTCIQRLARFDLSLNLIAASLQCICAQKLVRVICDECRTPLETTETKLQEMGFRAGEAENIDFYSGIGCEACGQSGYQGRTGLFEVLTVNDEIRDAIVRGLGVHEIRRIALASGLTTLRASGLHKIRKGVTTADEAFRENLIGRRPDLERTYAREKTERGESPSSREPARQPHPNRNEDRTIRAAEQYVGSGELEKANAEYEKWLAGHPEDWVVIRKAGDLYARLNRIDKAIAKYSRVAAHDEASGFNARAITTYIAILRIAPENVEALARLADLHAAEGQFPEAKKQYQTLADIYDRDGQTEAATEIIEKLVALDPSDLNIRQKYVDFLRNHGQEEAAIAELIAIAKDLLQNELVPEAIPLLEKGLLIDGNHLELRCRLAQAALFQDDSPRAIELLEEILENHPTDRTLLTVLGEAYEKAGRKEQAEAIVRQLGETRPNRDDLK